MKKLVIIFILLNIPYFSELLARKDTYSSSIISGNSWDNAPITINTGTSGVPSNTIQGQLCVNYRTKSLVSYVKFSINPEKIPSGMSAFSAKLTVKITYQLEGSNTFQDVMKVLEINYDPTAGFKYKNVAIETIANASKITVITNLSSLQLLSGTITPQHKDLLNLQVFTEHEYFGNFYNVFGNFCPIILPSPIFLASNCNVSFNASNNELTISWSSMHLNEGYELEYTFVDDYSNNVGSYISPNQLSFSFRNNSTRILTSKTSYTMPLVQEHGYLVFRVRGYGIAGDNFDKMFFGDYPTNAGGTNPNQTFLVSTFPSKYFISGSNVHTTDKINWQSITTFAEEGKNKTVVKYMDGTMRTRQTVTANNEEKNAIVAETIYDFNGRPAVEILPTPVFTSAIRYYNNFNKNQNDIPYSYSDFDILSTDPCQAMMINPLKQDPNVDGTNFSAGNYYSSSNPTKNAFNAYIPEGKGYPFSRVVYMPDATNRVVRQGNVGETFQPGKTANANYQNHDTKYYYGKPEQEKLDRLFGTNVGYAQFYQKNLVVDPNGQASVTYVDLDGKTIASALAGEKPAGIEALSSLTAVADITIDLLASSDVNDNEKHAITNSQSFLVTANNTTYNFNYDIKENTFNALSCSGKNYCLDCIYDLQITLIKDDCGRIEYDSNPLTVGNLTNLNFICNDANAKKQLSFSKVLDIGSYTITKKLIVNKQAAETYITNLLNDPNNTCIKSFTDFYNEAWNSRDTSRCKNACDACKDDAKLAGNNSQVTDAINECNKNWCNSDIGDLCDLARTGMLNDFTPGGQYAVYMDANGTYNQSASPISIFYQGSIFTGTPIKNIKNTNAIGNISVTLPGEQSKSLSAIVADPTSFEKLIDNWPEDLSEKLLPLHPEYCYLTFCDLQQVQSSRTFDTKYMTANTFSAAQQAGLLGTINSFYTQDPFYQYLQVNQDMVLLSLQMKQRFDNYFNTTPASNLVKIALFLTNCPSGNDINNCPANWGDSNNDDEEWQTFKNFYYNLKQEFVQKAREVYVRKSTGCCPNNYIGCKDANCYYVPIINIFTQNTNYCFGHYWIRPYYKDAAKRFPTINDVQFPGMDNNTTSVYDLTPNQINNLSQSLNTSQSCASCPELEAFKMMIWDLQDNKWLAQNGTIQADQIKGLKDEWRNRFTGNSQNSNIQISNNVNQIVLNSNTCTLTISVNPNVTINWLKAEITPTCLAISDKKNATLNVIVDGSFKTSLTINSSCDLFYCVGTAPTQPIVDNKCKCENDYAPTLAYQAGNIVKYNWACYLATKTVPVSSTSSNAPNNANLWTKICTVGAEISPPQQTTVNNNQQTYIPQNVCGCSNCDAQLPSPDLPFLNCDSLQQSIAKQQATEAYTNYISTIFKDLLQRYYDKCMQSLETFTMNYKDAEYHYTLYYYDQSGNLVATVPPAGIKPLPNTQLAAVKASRLNNGTPFVPAHIMMTQYKHNALNAVVWQKTPDAGVTNFYYDRLGRIVLSQNAKQAVAPASASYTYYDAQNRSVETGVIDVQGVANLKGTAWNNATWYSFILSRQLFEITHSYYDAALNTAISTAFGTQGQKNLRNRIATVAYYAKKVDLTNFKYEHATHYQYDIAGNVVELLQDFGENSPFSAVPTNVKLRSKHLLYDFDLASGKVNALYYQKGQQDQFIYKYLYNADNKLIQALSSENGIVWENDAKYLYYRHGPLARMELGTDKVQGVDYAYTLQGWLKGVNGLSTSTDKDMGRDGFTANTNPIPLAGYFGTNSKIAPDVYSYWLSYFKNDYAPIAISQPSISSATQAFGTGTYHSAPAELFNGNIRSMYTNLKSLGAMGMQYTYDQLNRLMEQKSYTFANNQFTLSANDAYKMRLAYDPNGNIQTMLRNGTAQLPNMDNLTYTYYNANGSTYTGNPSAADATNRLAFVNDITANDANYPNDIDNQAANNYTYDLIGNLISDKKEGILNIAWNVQNKVTEIKKSSNTLIQFAYDAMGQRVEKIVINSGSAAKKEYYIRDAQGNTLAIYQATATFTLKTEQHLYGSSRLGILMLEQKQNLSNGTLIGTSIATWRNSTQYELSNHLGNVLATISDARMQPTNAAALGKGDATLISAVDYYAFGMQMPSRSVTNSVLGDYRFGFNGKENNNQINNSNSIIDFEYRSFDVRIARWWGTDLLEKKYPMISPYIFGANNAIFFSDNDGREIIVLSKHLETVKKALNDIITEESVIISWIKIETGINKGYYKFTLEVKDPNIELSEETKLIQKLIKSDLTHKITIDVSSRNGSAGTSKFLKAKQGSNITWTAKDTDGGEDVNGSNDRPAFIGLLHELFHSEEWNDGTSDNSKSDVYETEKNQKKFIASNNPEGFKLSCSELDARFKENRYRHRIGQPYRKVGLNKLIKEAEDYLNKGKKK